MATLFCRPGDTQALKGCLAAALSKTSIVLKDLGQLPNPCSISNICLQLSTGTCITCPNAISIALGNAVDQAPVCLIWEWLSWEKTQLRPATYTRDPKQLQALLALLDQVSSGGHFLLGEKPSIADAAIYSTLLPLLEEPAPIIPMTPYLSLISKLPEVEAAKKQVLQGMTEQVAIQEVYNQRRKGFLDQQPKAPLPGQRNIMITSALPYVNNVPHLGNIIGCVLSADCYARFCRARGYNCIYICGTDEYGTATETKALEEGLTCQEVCDKYHAIHRGIYEWFDISFDKFGRTPTRMQTEISQQLFWQLEQSGNLLEDTIEQLYSEALDKFLADRFVVGTCPKCGYQDARGDQCDACGNLMNPTELIQPRCKITGTTPVIRTTKHIFLDLPKLTEPLQKYIKETSELGGWSNNCVQTTNAWMRDGLKPRCITRDLKWGIPVPKEGYRDKVFYVWFDAPIGYISITANYTPHWEQWWKSPDDVELVQFMGKDNVPFHTVVFPSTLLGSGEHWTMMRNISVTEYLNYEGGKFSKSRGIGVFGNDAKDTGIPPEVWRYYLLTNRPEQSDTDFKWSDLEAKNNSELLANLGNFLNRSLMFVQKFFEGRVPQPTDKGQEEVQALGQAVGAKVEEYLAALEKIKIKEGIRLAMAISSDGNKFFQDTEPWVLVKSDKERCATIVAAGAGMARLLAALVQPYMPSLTKKIQEQANLSDADLMLTDDLAKLSFQPHLLMPAGHKIGEPSPLVKKIDPTRTEELRARYAGPQSERTADSASSTATTVKPPKVAAQGKVNMDSAESKGKSKSTKGVQENGTPGVEGEKPAPVKEGAKAQEGRKAKEGGKAKGGASAPRPVDVSRLDIRVGLIQKAWRHPDADSLYVEEVDVGEGTPRQVVSGLVKYIPLEEMQGRRVCVVCNMKPANMRGIQSQAMVLAANNHDNTQVELVEPPANVAPGERVEVEGYQGEPDELLKPKEKVFEQVSADLKTSEDKVVSYKGLPLTTSRGPCTVRSIVNGGIR